MPTAKTKSQNTALRELPSVDEVLRSDAARNIAARAGERQTAQLARRVIDVLRHRIIDDPDDGHSKQSLQDAAEDSLKYLWAAQQLSGIHRVINATGVVIHTNLGRAPLSENARKAVADEAFGYCTLEYDRETGKRGRRGARSEQLIIELTGAEDALIVNNCAAAAYFVLAVFARGGEVIISRGEMVEIGGDFRVPDVLAQSGAILKEVGTTNRTKLADYQKAINDQTRLILRVHPSNYRIVGFTSMPSLIELANLAASKNILLYEDLGSGALIDLTPAGLTDEPVVSDSISAGAHIVTFSGDKLLGGPQSGIIAGRRTHIEQLRTHPLYRAFRVDKVAYAALEATLASYRRDAAFAEIPVLKMLSLNSKEIGARAALFSEKLNAALRKGSALKVEIIEGVSAVGGGAAAAVELDTRLIAISHQNMSASTLEETLRRSDPPVIARIVDERVMIDLRTVAENEEENLIEIICGIDQ